MIPKNYSFIQLAPKRTSLGCMIARKFTYSVSIKLLTEHITLYCEEEIV